MRKDENLIDCEIGRNMGCATYCCRLLVRLDQDERPPTKDGSVSKSCLDKDLDGFCIYLDRENCLCSIWDTRPRICREYDCNFDPMLQTAIRVGVKNIVQLSKDTLKANVSDLNKTIIPKTKYEKKL